MRGKCPTRIKSKLSHIHTCLCQHLQLSLGLATVDFGSQINMSLFPFGILFVYVLLRNLCFFGHSHLFSCTFVFSFKIQSIHCLLKERLLRIPSPGLSNLLFGPTSILIYLFIYLFHCIFCMVLLLVGEGNGTPPQYSCLENPRDGRAWQATVHGVAKSRTQLSNFTTTTTWY